MKKILCILLVVALLSAVMCVPAFAAEEVSSEYYTTVVNGKEILPFPSDFDFETYPYIVYDCSSNGLTVLAMYAFSSIDDIIAEPSDMGPRLVFVGSSGVSYMRYSSTNGWSTPIYGYSAGANLHSVVGLSTFDIYDSDTGELLISDREIILDNGVLYPSEYRNSKAFSDVTNSIGATLNTGVSMLGSVAQTIATTPLLFVCFTVGFIGIGVALFKRIRK